jgi:hypothetical protein
LSKPNPSTLLSPSLISSPVRHPRPPSSSLEPIGAPHRVCQATGRQRRMTLVFALLNYLSPCPNIPINSIPLPIYRGNELIDPSAKTSTSSSHRPGKGSKAYAWSRGIGSELSPLKM